MFWDMQKLLDDVSRSCNWNNKTPISWKFLGILKPWWWFNEFIMSYKALHRFIVLLENQMESITLPDTKGLESQRGEQPHNNSMLNLSSHLQRIFFRDSPWGNFCANLFLSFPTMHDSPRGCETVFISNICRFYSYLFTLGSDKSIRVKTNNARKAISHNY